MTMEATTTIVEIIDYSPKFKEYFKNLNMEWMSQFKIDNAHLAIVEHPEEQIIQKGGEIFFAEVDGKIVGTGALLRESNKLYEIAYMAVTPAYQGRHIGQSLLKKAIDKAILSGAKQVYLITSTKLKASLEMYRTFGFRESPFDPEMSVYQGSDVKMTLNLK
jgi:putative acetyltransferase